MMMKRLIYLLLPLVTVLFASCDPTTEELGSPSKSITSEALTNSFTLTAKSEGNNNITVSVDPINYVRVHSAENDAILAQGRTSELKFQVIPPAREYGVYLTTINADGTITKSDTKTVNVTEFTDLPEIFDQVFGKVGDGWGTTTWTWDDTVEGNYWGNAGWGSSESGGWWGAPTGANIDDQATAKGLPNDGIGGWFSLSLDGVKTSRGETGSVIISSDVDRSSLGQTANDSWGLGTMTFNGTIPLMGILPNDGDQRCSKYVIVKADGEHLVLCAQSTSGWEGWYLCYKRIPNKE